MTNEEKAIEIGVKYQTPCHGVGDCEFEAYQSALEAMAWKDEQFAAEKKALIDKACDLYNSDLQKFQNLLGKIRKNAKGLIDIDGSLSDFRKAMEETK